MANISITGAPVEEGTGRRGCRFGPAALRTAGMARMLAAAGHNVTDRGNLRPGKALPILHPNPAIRSLAGVVAWIGAITAAVYEACADTIPIILGGDHSIAAGSLPALNRRATEEKRKLFLLWLDAHCDFHTLNTTTSGHLHGVPLAYIVGRTGFEGYFPANPFPISPDRVCLMGLRSVDSAEREALASTGITVHMMQEMRNGQAMNLLRAFLDRVSREDGLLHLSFDIDFLAPAIAPAVGTPVAGGPSRHDAFAMMRLLGESGLVRSVDIAELNPSLDGDGRTARLMVELMATLLCPRPHLSLSARSFEPCLQN
ncbi:MAG TPA: arginase [Sphingobium sp.]